MGEETEDYCEALEKHRVDVVKSLDLDRQFILSYLRSNSVLDDEDCQIILHAGPSRQQKASKFLDVLATKGPDGYLYFVKSLEFEHQHLYEVFTGKKPVEQRTATTATAKVPWTLISDKQLLDYDREFLVKELTKLAEHNRSVTYMYSKLLEEKKILQNSFEEFSVKLHEKNEQIEELHNEMEMKKVLMLKSDDTKDMHAYIYHCQELLRDNSEKCNIIIALQANLLSMKEEIEITKKRNQELRSKNENLMEQVRDLTINYDWQRTCSKRLSEEVDQKSVDLREVADTKKEIYSLKFQLTRITEEKDFSVQRLEEFRKVMSALNARHDILQQEKCNEVEKRDQVSESYLQLREQIVNLELQVNEEVAKNHTLARKTKRLEEEVETYKEQREFYSSEREQGIRERERITKERDETLRFNRGLQASRDEAVRKQIEITTQFEAKYANYCKELEKAQKENQEIRQKMHRDSVTRRISEIGVSNDNCLKKEDKVVSSDNTESNEEQADKESDTDKIPVYNWRDRTNTDVLKSAYRKLNPLSSPMNNKAMQISPLNLDTQQMSWVYKSLNGGKSPVAELLELPMMFPGMMDRGKSCLECNTGRKPNKKTANSKQKERSQTFKIEGLHSSHPPLTRQQARARSSTTLETNWPETPMSPTPFKRDRANAFDPKDDSIVDSAVYMYNRVKLTQTRRRSSEPSLHYKTL